MCAALHPGFKRLCTGLERILGFAQGNFNKFGARYITSRHLEKQCSCSDWDRFSGKKKLKEMHDSNTAVNDGAPDYGGRSQQLS